MPNEVAAVRNVAHWREQFAAFTLGQCETAIDEANKEQGRVNAIRAAAFQEIHSRELWRPGYRSFVAYIEEKWGIQKTQTYQVLGLPKPPPKPRKIAAPKPDTCTKPVDSFSGPDRKSRTAESSEQHEESSHLDTEANGHADPLDALLGPLRDLGPEDGYREPPKLRQVRAALKEMEGGMGRFVGQAKVIKDILPGCDIPWTAWGKQLGNMFEVAEREVAKAAARLKEREMERRQGATR